MRKIYSLLAALLILNSTSVFAADDFPTSNRAYIGVGAGIGKISMDSSESQTTKQAFAYQANMGYLWQLSRRFALGAELAYTKYPDSRGSRTGSETRHPFFNPETTTTSYDDTLSGYSIAAMAVAQFFMTPHLSVDAKLGFAWMTQTYSSNSTWVTVPQMGSPTSGSNPTATDSDGSLMSALGIGAAYAFNQKFSMTIDVQGVYYRIFQPNGWLQALGHTGKPAASGLLGIRYSF
jgi:hypothetical protein